MKEQFPYFLTNEGRSQIYFDSAATSHKPKCVIDAISNFYSKDYATVHRGVYSSANKATDMVETCRSKVAEFIGADSDEIIFTHSTTESINLLKYTFGQIAVQEGDEILVCVAEHHSNYLPWKVLSEEKGAKFITFGLNDDGTVDLEDYKSKLSSKTKIVAISHQSNVLGLINPVKEIAELAHKAGAKVVVDGAQIIAHEKVDVKEIDADFYVFSAHKMYGPTGIGVLYGKKHLLEKMPPFHSGGGMVEVATGDELQFRSAPYKFEAGTPMIASIIGFSAAIDFLKTIELDHVQELSEMLYDQLKDKVQFLTPLCRGNAILSFTMNDIHPLDLGMLLSLEGVCIRVGNMCAQPLMKYLNKTDVCRISFACYNTKKDVEDFVKILNILKVAT